MNVLLVCRGCCCGTTKHAHVDHEAQLFELSRAGARVEVTGCLGTCRWSNVIAAVDPESGEQVWFAKVLDRADTAAVADWLADPNTSPRPDHLVREPGWPQRERALLLTRGRTQDQHA